jgi:hypothetical protein
MTTSNIIFPKGMNWQKKGDKAPENLKGKISIRVDQFLPWLEEVKEYKSQNGWMNFGLWKSKNTGELYISLDTYKPATKDATPDDIPF